MIIDPKLEKLLRKICSSFNVYYNPYFAPCPMCYGGNTLRPRQSVERNQVYSYAICVNCDSSGDVDEWIVKLESEYAPSPTRSEYLTKIYKDTFDHFQERFRYCAVMLDKMGYTTPCMAPGKPFSLLDKYTFQNIKKGPTIMGEREHYIIIPCYKHVGLIDDLLVCDGDRFERLSKDNLAHYSTAGYCGYLEEQTTKKLFVAPSVRDYFKILGKQTREGVSAERFPLITDLSTVAITRGSAGTFHPGKILADKIYHMKSNRHVSKNLNHFADNIAGELRIIPDYESHTIAELALHSDEFSERIKSEASEQNIMAIQRSLNPYRFYLEGNCAMVHTSHLDRTNFSEWIHIKKKTTNGLIHVVQEDERSFTIRTRYAKDKIHTYRNVVPQLFANKDVLNSLLAQRHESENKRDKPVQLLDWFNNEDILPNLMLISELTAEVLLPKGG